MAVMGGPSRVGRKLTPGRGFCKASRPIGRVILTVARKQSRGQRSGGGGGGGEKARGGEPGAGGAQADVAFEAKLAQLRERGAQDEQKQREEEEDPDAAILPVPDFLRAAERPEQVPVVEYDGEEPPTPPPLWLTIAAPLSAIVLFYIGGAALTNLVGTLLFPIIYPQGGSPS